MKKYDHKSPVRSGVVLVNLGTPSTASVGAIARWLGQFLSDPRVIELPRLLWLPLLHGVILRTRPRRLVEKYRSILLDGQLPLRAHTQALTAAVNKCLQADWPEAELSPAPLVRFAMTYGGPSIASVLDELRELNVARLLVLPMYAQYSATTTAPIYDQCFKYFQRKRYLPELHLTHSHHNHPAYINGLEKSLRAHWEKHGRGEHLLISFHGLPIANISKGDPYFCQAHASTRLLVQKLGLAPDEWSLSFQSRFGSQKWLFPSTSDRIVELAQKGTKKLDVICPGFSCDCIETLDEIVVDAAKEFQSAGGGSLRAVPCLNSGAENARLYTDLVLCHRDWLHTQQLSQADNQRLLNDYLSSAQQLGLSSKDAQETKSN